MAVRRLAEPHLQPKGSSFTAGNLARTLCGVLGILWLTSSMSVSASGQTILEQLNKLEQSQPPPPRKSEGETLRDRCLAAEKDARLEKCRNHYLSNGYSVEWRGKNSSTSHPILLEVLVRGDTAAICYSPSNHPSDQMYEWSPCTTLQRDK